jgi:hypothetical protein
VTSDGRANFGQRRAYHVIVHFPVRGKRRITRANNEQVVYSDSKCGLVLVLPYLVLILVLSY